MFDEWERERMVSRIKELETENARLKGFNEQYCITANNDRAKYRQAMNEVYKHKVVIEELQKENILLKAQNLKERNRKKDE